MKLSKKESSFLEVFLLNKKTLTAQEISETLKISTKTVYRLVKKINSLSQSKQVICTKSGKGLKLNYKEYLKLINKDDDALQVVNSESRKNKVLLELLFKSPKLINSRELYDGEYISNDLILKDLEEMKRICADRQLSLVAQNNKVKIIGDEYEIRKLIYELISEDIFIKSDSYTFSSNLATSYDLDFITSLLDYIEDRLDGTIPYPYNVNIFSHLYILLLRFRKGLIKIDNSTHIDALTKEEKMLIKENDKKFTTSCEVIEKINNYLVTTIDEIEAFYLFQYILASRVEDYKNEFKSFSRNNQIIDLANYLVSNLENELNLTFSEILLDDEFLEHLNLMLYRNKKGIIIKNELLMDIKREYTKLFNSIKNIVQNFFTINSINQCSDDEIGFLVLYFAKIFEKKKFNKKVLIMCSSGVGTSELLKVKVKKAFPNLEIVDVVSLNQYKKIYKNKEIDFFDFILTTVNNVEQCGVPVLLMNFMFTELDKENVNKLLEEW